jgi:hypothetical protein
MSDLESFSAALQELRERILRHPVYAAVNDEARLRRFMQSHVFAVWDFMSLLKGLQRRLTSVDLPWRPVGDPESRRLINEIVLAEESDESNCGGYASHFELYIEAMTKAGAPTATMENFLKKIEEGVPVARALEAADVPSEARDFVESTFEILATESLPGIAAALAFGREDLVPPMFLRLVEGLRGAEPARWSTFLYYLERHVQLDGEVHGPMAGRLLQRLCGNDPAAWRSAEEAARLSLLARLRFWDALQRQFSI